MGGKTEGGKLKMRKFYTSKNPHKYLEMKKTSHKHKNIKNQTHFDFQYHNKKSVLSFFAPALPREAPKRSSKMTEVSF